MANAAGGAPNPKGRGFFEVGIFKKLRVTEAVRERRMGSEFIVQVCQPCELEPLCLIVVRS